MSPLRWDVLLVAFVLALPVLALGLRGDLSSEEVTLRLPWCLLAGWGVVALLRAAGTPRTTNGPAAKKHQRPAELADTPAPDSDRSPTA
ncbi:hypothetical protein GCM10010531_27340 [Blastococcus jejuensis]|uniref:Uncharacterized protein n=1 Tax=Blastococcus jejuensis TaxID=351224 RepID=A0ABP6PBI2_9ACTN